MSCYRFIKKAALWVLLSLVAGQVVAAEFKAPTLSVSNITIDAITFSKVDLLLTFLVGNPNQEQIDVESIAYHLVLNNNPPLTGKVVQRESFPAKQSRQVTVPVSLSMDQQVYPLLQSLQQPGASNYNVSGLIQLANRAKPISFTHKGSMRLPGLTQ